MKPRSWPRDEALEERILAAIARSPDGLSVPEMAKDPTVDAIFERVQLSCWDLANANKIAHIMGTIRYVLAR